MTGDHDGHDSARQSLTTASSANTRDERVWSDLPVMTLVERIRT